MGNINKMCAGAGKQFDTDSCRQQFSGFVIFVVRNSVMEDSGYLTWMMKLIEWYLNWIDFINSTW